MSTEALARLAYFPGLGKLLEEWLPPKVIEIDGEGPRVAEMEDRADEGMGPRNKRVIGAIEAASFTGKGDKPVVVALYRKYVAKVGNAMNASGEKVDGEYEGEWKAGKPEGRGVFRFANGNVYEGELKAGEKEGRGVYRFADGTVYDGEMKADKMEGRGVLRLASGNVYDGELKADKKEGRGVYRFASGNVQSGFYKQGAHVGEGVKWMADGRQAVRLRDGKAVEVISLEEARRTAERLGLTLPSPLPSDGNVYEGERNAAGEAEGRGVMQYAGGDVYDGELKAGAPEGRGVMRYASGNVYEGEFKAGLFEGRGVFRFADGNVYDGEWKADKMEGRGVYRHADGEIYEGEYKAGKREGRGVMRYASGNVYDGEWKAGKREGRGVYRHANGDVDTVCFKQSAPVGEAVRWTADGRRAVRLRDGKRVEWISLEEARQTAERLRLTLPSPLPSDGNVYEGERNAAGEAEGRGVMQYAGGDVYDGEWKAGVPEGRGVYRYANGDVYDGEWKADKKEGRGVYRYANGDIYDGEFKAGNREGRGVERFANGDVVSGFFKQDARVGEGVEWDIVDADAAAKGHPGVSCDRSGMEPIVGIRYNLIGQNYDLCEAEFEKLSAELKPLYRAIHPGQRSCWRLRDGKRVEWISTEEARQTAERLGLPIPSPLPGASKGEERF